MLWIAVVSWFFSPPLQGEGWVGMVCACAPRSRFISSFRRKSLTSSSRRKPGSICFCLLALTRKPTHVPVVFRPPSWRPGHFLCLPRESNQREHTLAAPAGFFLRALAAAEREPWKSRARPSWPQKPRRAATIETPRSSSRRKPGPSAVARGFALDVGPCGAAKGGRIRPAHRAGRREGSRRFCRRPWMACRQNPGRP